MGFFRPRASRDRGSDHEQQLGLARPRPGDGGPSRPGAGASRQPVEHDLELEGVAGHDLAAEAGAVDPAEEGECPREALVLEHGHRTELGQRLDHEDAGHRRASREVAGEERFVAREVPPPPGRPARLHLVDLGEEQERWTVGEDVSRAHPSSLAGV
jgi:hypothetical protein